MSRQPTRGGTTFFYILFGILAVMVIWLLSPYWSVIAIALVTVVMLKPLYDWISQRDRVKGHTRVATSLTLIAFFLLIIIPLILIGWLLYTEISDLIASVETSDTQAAMADILISVEEWLQGFPSMSDFEFDPDQMAESVASLSTAALNWVANLVISLGASLPNLFIGAIIFLIVVASLLPILDDMEDRTESLSPMDVRVTHIYLLKAREMIVSVVKGVFLLAIIQGLMMGVSYWLAGVPFVAFWTILSMAFAILPVVGISFIVWPIAIVFFITGNWQSAVIVLVAFYVFVNPTDLVLRPRLVSKEAYLNFTLMLLALFGGLAMGGLLGMIYGPVIMILFMTTIDIYGEYFAHKKEDSGEADSIGEALESLPEGSTAELEAPE